MALNLLQVVGKRGDNYTGEYLEDASCSETLQMTYFVRKFLPNAEITKVSVVHNNYLQAMYLLKKMEYEGRYGFVREKLMFHATSECNVDSIIQNNLDWRRVSRNKFGSGVSFSDDADYANFYSNSNNGVCRAFIIANVLVSNICAGHQNMTIPIMKADTAIGNNNKVYVKFNDNEFMPLYVVYYNTPPRETSKFYHRKFYRGRHFSKC